MFNSVDNYEWKYYSSESAGVGSDKSVSLTDQLYTLPIGIHVDLTSTATVGNRFVTVDYRDSSSTVVSRIVAGKEQAASLSRVYDFFPGAPFLDDFYATTELLIPLPQVLVPPGGSVRVYDSAAVDAAADTLNFFLTAYQRRV